MGHDRPKYTYPRFSWIGLNQGLVNSNGKIRYMIKFSHFLRQENIFITSILLRYPPLTFIIVLNPFCKEVMVPTDYPTYTQFNVIHIKSVFVTLTLEKLMHSPGFMSTPKRYLSWLFY